MPLQFGVAVHHKPLYKEVHQLPEEQAILIRLTCFVCCVLYTEAL